MWWRRRKVKLGGRKIDDDVVGRSVGVFAKIELYDALFYHCHPSATVGTNGRGSVGAGAVSTTAY